MKKTHQACGDDIEMQSHWAKYLCIIVAGLLENAIKAIYTDFVIQKAPRPIADYASSNLSKIQNPKSSKFIEVAKSFKLSWGDELKDFLEQEGRADAIDSIMQNRHQIAHGKSSDITIARLKEYLQKAKEVLDFIEEQCNR